MHIPVKKEPEQISQFIGPKKDYQLPALVMLGYAAPDVELREWAATAGLEYVRNDDTMRCPFDAPPVIVNYFYHEEVRKLGKRKCTQ